MKNEYFDIELETMDDIENMFMDIMLAEQLPEYDFEAMYAEEMGWF